MLRSPSNGTRGRIRSTLRTHDVRQWIPGFGINFSIDPNAFLFAGVHRGFAPPGPGATEDTDAESSVNYEFGYRSAQASGIAVQVTVVP